RFFLLNRPLLNGAVNLAEIVDTPATFARVASNKLGQRAGHDKIRNRRNNPSQNKHLIPKRPPLVLNRFHASLTNTCEEFRFRSSISSVSPVRSDSRRARA